VLLILKAAGGWLLAAGYRLLVTDCWLLATVVRGIIPEVAVFR
jgi:hypothetical protein